RRALVSSATRRRGDRIGVAIAAIAHSRLWHEPALPECPLHGRFRVECVAKLKRPRWRGSPLIFGGVLVPFSPCGSYGLDAWALTPDRILTLSKRQPPVVGHGRGIWRGAEGSARLQ